MTRPTKQPLYIVVSKTGDFYHSDRDPECLYLSRAGLRRAGWTDKLIDALMPVACRMAENPHHPGGKPMALYSVTRIQRLEQHPVQSGSVGRISKRSALKQKQAAQQVAQLQQIGLELALPLQAEAIGDLARDW